MPELNLNDLRARVLAGEDVPLETLQQAIAQLRANRATASEAAASSPRQAKKAAAASAARPIEDLLGDLGL